jgi:hypothetical protein
MFLMFFCSWFLVFGLSVPNAQRHGKSFSQPTKEAIPSADEAPALSLHFDVIGSVPLPNRPPSHGPIGRVPLQHAKKLTFRHPTRLIVWRRLHPLFCLGRVRLRGFFRRP